MRWLDRLTRGFAAAPATGGGNLIERLGNANGLTPDVRKGDVTAYFFRGDATMPRREVVIHYKPGNSFAIFSCASKGKFSARSMTVPLLAAFLVRNDESTLGKWQLHLGEHRQITAYLQYSAPISGLTAGLFRAICVSLLTEVAFVENVLHGEGLL